MFFASNGPRRGSNKLYLGRLVVFLDRRSAIGALVGFSRFSDFPSVCIGIELTTQCVQLVSRRHLSPFLVVRVRCETVGLRAVDD